MNQAKLAPVPPELQQALDAASGGLEFGGDAALTAKRTIAEYRLMQCHVCRGTGRARRDGRGGIQRDYGHTDCTACNGAGKEWRRQRP
jgi:hypothetical protein